MNRLNELIIKRNHKEFDKLCLINLINESVNNDRMSIQIV